MQFSPKSRVTFDIFFPFFNFQEKIFPLNKRPRPFPLLEKKALGEDNRFICNGLVYGWTPLELCGESSYDLNT